MLGWIVSGLLIVPGFLASLLVARDAPQFVLMQMVVGLFVLVLVVALLAFWPKRWADVFSHVHKPH